jgi:hypothetical protein
MSQTENEKRMNSFSRRTARINNIQDGDLEKHRDLMLKVRKANSTCPPSLSIKERKRLRNHFANIKLIAGINECLHNMYLPQ